MKRIIEKGWIFAGLAALLALFLIFFGAGKARALSFSLGLTEKIFAGKVLTFLPITCLDGIEVFTIRPVGSISAGPFYLSLTTKRYRNFSITPGSWILGFYDQIPTLCVTDSVPPGPVTVFEVKRFGSSLPF